MERPQTVAFKLGSLISDKRLKAIGDFGCCAFVALWIMGIEGIAEPIRIILNNMGKGLDYECLVYWRRFFKDVSGRDVWVEFRDIQSLDDLKGIKGRIAVRFDLGKNSHWVGVEDGKVIYNSLENSACVDFGKPTTARIVYF